MGFKWFGIDSNEKEVKRLQSLVEKINELEGEYQPLSDEALKAKTAEFKARITEAIAPVKVKAEQQIGAIRQELDEAKDRFVNVPAGLEKESTKIINELEEKLKRTTKQSEEELHKAKQAVLDKLIPEAFAAVREAARRTIKQRHFDVQLMGGIVLHQGKIAEMRTGEGKTLTATLPLYLNALTGDGCHLVTVNDYLARRDPNWMGPVYNALGISVACIYSQTPDNRMPSFIYDPTFESEDKRWHLRPVTRKEAYTADITYGTNNEFGFDYLRDNMVGDIAHSVQRPLIYAIVDEVDNLLIDEARTPLIISGPAEEAGQTYNAVDSVVRRMKFKVMPQEPATTAEKEEEAALEDQFDFLAFEKTRNVKETPRGQEKLAQGMHMKVEDLFGSGDGESSAQFTPEEAKKRNDVLTIFRKSMAANALYKKDVDYVVKDGEVIIVDEFTGRLMFGRRYSEGLHQCIEAKEGVKIQRESLTFATVTFQNFFRMYKKLAGMTGTALTEAEEFSKIYQLEVVVIPPNKPMVREDFQDQIYKNEKGKFNAVAKDVEAAYKLGRPVLIGTVSIEKSEYLSGILNRKGIHHNVLNAKNHLKEGEIIAEAGKPGAVTVATNMAGRGVDIILGGKKPDDGEEKLLQEWQAHHDQVLAAGGLHVIGTDRHESRRIDNQLRGRAGRQGDPGSSCFFISLEDDIVRRFGGDRIKGLMEWAGMDEETPIENSMISRMIADVQKRVEGYNFDIRKHLVEYDDVVNKQREIIYSMRRNILAGNNLKNDILNKVEMEIRNSIATHCDSRGYDRDTEGLIREVNMMFPLPRDLTAEKLAEMPIKEIEKKFTEIAHDLYEKREKEFGDQDTRLLERLLMIKIIDSLWVGQLTDMEEMRLQAGFDTLKQMKAVDAYKIRGLERFQELTDTIQHDVAYSIFHVTIRRDNRPAAPSPMAKASGRTDTNAKQPTAKNKVGRNDPCPCGSGKKYKHCCGK
ncbi:MAG: preprotein translocase subunit SecA [Dehalococcoidales bacterium]|nr:preprotein translocase subunit SecA [Dehalococcoidales bacterium]